MSEAKQKTFAQITADLDAACAERIALCLPFLQQYGTEITNAISSPDEGSVRIRIRGALPDYLKDKVAFRNSLLFAHSAFRDVFIHQSPLRGDEQTFVGIIFVATVPLGLSEGSRKRVK